MQQKHELYELQTKLKNRLEGVRWVRPEGMHLTLRFFGEVEDIKIGLIKKAMDSTASLIDSFALRYGGFGVFPSPNKARVIWTGLSEGAPAVIDLAGELENNLSGQGFKPEKRPYRPHLTLGRLRYTLPENMLKMIVKEESSFQTSAKEIDGLTLFESRLFKQGAVYNPVYGVLLKNKKSF